MVWPNYIWCYRNSQKDSVTQLNDGEITEKFLLLKQNLIDYGHGGNIDERSHELDAATSNKKRRKKRVRL